MFRNIVKNLSVSKCCSWFVQQTEAFYVAAFVVHLSVFDYLIYSFKRRPRLSAAHESKNIKERRPRISAALIHNNAALNRSTVRQNGSRSQTKKQLQYI